MGSCCELIREYVDSVIRSFVCYDIYDRRDNRAYILRTRRWINWSRCKKSYSVRILNFRLGFRSG